MYSSHSALDLFHFNIFPSCMEQVFNALADVMSSFTNGTYVPTTDDGTTSDYIFFRYFASHRFPPFLSSFLLTNPVLDFLIFPPNVLAGNFSLTMFRSHTMPSTFGINRSNQSSDFARRCADVAITVSSIIIRTRICCFVYWWCVSAFFLSDHALVSHHLPQVFYTASAHVAQ